MPFTFILVLFALLASAMLFAVIYRMKGFRAAFLTSGIVFLLLLVLMMLALNVMLSAM